MPNWSYNKLAVRGEKKKVIAFFNAGIATLEKSNAEYEVCTSPLLESMTIQQIADHLNLGFKCGKPTHRVKTIGLSMDDFVTMPQTYKDFDTTNRLPPLDSYIFDRERNYRVDNGIKENYPMSMDNIPEDRLAIYKKEYAEYVVGYKNAVKYQQETYGVVGWYEWGRTFWGTKWNAYFENIEVQSVGDDEILVLIGIDTAWAMPEEFVNTIQKNNPDLHFAMYGDEESGAYCGYWDAHEPDSWIENRTDLWDTPDGYDEMSEEEQEAADEKMNEEVGQVKEEIYAHFIDYMRK